MKFGIFLEIIWFYNIWVYNIWRQHGCDVVECMPLLFRKAKRCQDHFGFGKSLYSFVKILVKQFFIWQILCKTYGYQFFCRRESPKYTRQKLNEDNVATNFNRLTGLILCFKHIWFTWAVWRSNEISYLLRECIFKYGGSTSDYLNLSSLAVPCAAPPKILSSPVSPKNLKMPHPMERSWIYILYSDPANRVAAQQVNLNKFMSERLIKGTMNNMVSASSSRPLNRFPKSAEVEEMAKSLVIAYLCLRDDNTGHASIID